MEDLKKNINSIFETNNFDINELNLEKLNRAEKITALYQTFIYIYNIFNNEIIAKNKELIQNSNKTDKAINNIFLRIIIK